MAIASTVTLPSFWASALLMDDFSELEPGEAKRCRDMVAEFRQEGISVVSYVEDSERFTWSYDLYDSGADCRGGNVCDYVALSSN